MCLHVFIEDFQSYKALRKIDTSHQSLEENLDQHTKVLTEDEEYLSEDTYSRAKYDGEYLLNEEILNCCNRKKLLMN